VTAAPLAIGDLVISGVAGGNAARLSSHTIRRTGKSAGGFGLPLPGEPGSVTWKGTTAEHPGSPMIGSYDADLGLLYWQVGNPGSDLKGEEPSATTCTRFGRGARREDGQAQVVFPVRPARRVALRRAAAADADR
jgi:hypothetical protein